MTKKKKKTKKKQSKPVQDRHKMLLKQISDNIRNGMSMGEAMQAVGYSESYSKNPNHLRDTDSWKELVNDQLPDKLLAKVHKGLLMNKGWRARYAGLTEAYKVKKKYGDITIKHKFSELSDQDIEDEIAEIFAEAIGLAEREDKKNSK